MEQIFRYLLVVVVLTIISTTTVFAYNTDLGRYFLSTSSVSSVLLNSPIYTVTQQRTFDYFDDETQRSAERAIYLTSNTAGYKPRFDLLINTVATSSDLNAVVIDLKNVLGRLAYVPDNHIKDSVPSRLIPDIKSVIAQIKEKDIYLIGRIAVFKDQEFIKSHPEVAVRDPAGNIWRDDKGNGWVDPSSRAMWDYTIAISQAAYDLGFDEINLDYIRFPSDGDLTKVRYPITRIINNDSKAGVITEFNKYVRGKLLESHPGKLLSADVFGMVVTHDDGLGVGQRLHSFLPYYDYIAPMIYPALYPKGFRGISIPNNAPYEIVHKAIEGGKQKITQYNTLNNTNYSHKILRPWIQGYTCTWCEGYDGSLIDIDAQVSALKDQGLDGYMIWNSSNVYPF